MISTLEEKGKRRRALLNYVDELASRCQKRIVTLRRS